MASSDYQAEITRAADAIREATALLFTSGAGLGVDSGLPDYRGPAGFWKAYPALRALGLSLPTMSNAEWFRRDPWFAWGFWGHQMKLYRNAVPHYGFEVMKRLADSKMDKDGYFVFYLQHRRAFPKIWVRQRKNRRMLWIYTLDAVQEGIYILCRNMEWGRY